MTRFKSRKQHFLFGRSAVFVTLPSAAQLRRSHPRSLLEFPPEAGGVDIAHSQADIVNGHIRGKQQFFRLFQAQRPHIVGKILPHLFFEQITHVGDAYMENVRQVGNGEIRGGEIFVYQLFNLRGIDNLVSASDWKRVRSWLIWDWISPFFSQ